MKRILDEITEGKYQQNDIITERELIEKYGVSKSPVREALIELCKEDVLESRPRMGYQIRPISIKEISDIVGAEDYTGDGSFEKNLFST